MLAYFLSRTDDIRDKTNAEARLSWGRRSTVGAVQDADGLAIAVPQGCKLHSGVPTQSRTPQLDCITRPPQPTNTDPQQLHNEA